MRFWSYASIGERLGVGFGLIAVVVAALIWSVSRWHDDSAQAQSVYSDQIAPLQVQAERLERNILHTGIAVRAALLSDNPERIAEFERAVRESQDALQRFDQPSMLPEGVALLSDVTNQVEAYLREAQALVARRTEGDTDFVAQDSLADRRDRLHAELQRLRRRQEARADEALAAIAATRERISAGLFTASVLTALVLIALSLIIVRAVSTPARSLAKVAEALRAGDWRPALALADHAKGRNGRTVRDEMRLLGSAFGSAAVALERREQRLQADSRVARAVASSLEREALCEAALKDIVAFVRAEIGVIYWAPPSSSMLYPIAKYAVAGDLGPVEIGEGVPGQAARQRQPMRVDDIPPDSGFTVRLGYDQVSPRSVVAVPIIFRDTLQGVVTVACLREVDPESLAFLEASAQQLAIGLQNVGAYEQIQSLLGDLRARHDEIQAQNEELQAQNEEIQAQSGQLQAQHEELYAQNEELTQQGEQLRMHASLLADADKRKNEFLAVLAHELRNPLGSIVNGMFALRRSSAGSAEAEQAREIIERQSRHMVRLIDDLLDIARISEGRINMERERVDISEVVRLCVEDHAPQFERSRIDLEVDLPETRVYVDGDPTRLHQVLGNLLTNSLKFCGEGGRVRLRAALDRDTSEVLLSVADDGVGIDPALLPTLFEPFTQGTASAGKSNGGLGLGLALVRSLVDLHGGRVEARSDGPGRGAEIIVRLPVALERQLPAEVSAVSAGELSGATTGNVERVLLIEDNEDVAQSLGVALELAGYQVMSAATGEEGLGIAREWLPDLVLCDVGLPDMDGYEIARRFRLEPQLRSVLMIALTGYAAPRDREKAALAGFDLHVAKPLDIDRLGTVLAELNAGRASGSPRGLD